MSLRKPLSTNFEPTQYDLSIHKNETQNTFEGHVKIIGKKKWRPNHRFVFHQKDLKIISASVCHVNKNNISVEIPIYRINTHNSYQEVRVHTTNMIYPGHYEITIEFRGKLTSSTKDILEDLIRDSSQKVVWSTIKKGNARMVFPCIDEVA